MRKNIFKLVVLLLFSLLVGNTTFAGSVEPDNDAGRKVLLEPQRVELVFILDRSGSMGGLEKDTIGGYNAFLDKQKQMDGQVRLTTVLFDNNYELLHNRVDLQEVKPLTDKDYYVRGSTALLDAMGRTINQIERNMKSDEEKNRPTQVIFVITTDGMENASREFSYATVRSLVERKKKEQDWQFIFLGANIDSAAAASKVGIAPNMTADYHADSKGVQRNYEALAQTIKSLRSTGQVPENWQKDIREDFENRKNK